MGTDKVAEAMFVMSRGSSHGDVGSLDASFVFDAALSNGKTLSMDETKALSEQDLLWLGIYILKRVSVYVRICHL